MARPKALQTRHHRLTLFLTEREYDLAQSRAKAAAMRLPLYARRRLLETSALPKEIFRDGFDPLTLNALTRIGSNLNQAVRVLTTFPERAHPDDLTPLLTEIRHIIRLGRFP